MADQSKLEELLNALSGMVPFSPGALLADQATTQEEFLPGTEARAIQDAMDARGWAYRFVCRVGESELIIIERQYDDYGLVLTQWDHCG